MNDQEKIEYADKLGKETQAAIEKATKGLEEKAKLVAEEVVKNNGGITKATFEAYQSEQKEAEQKLKEIAIKQGTTIAELQNKLIGMPDKEETLESRFAENKDRFNKGETVQFMVYTGKDGENKAVEVKANDNGGYSVVNKLTGTHATVNAVAGAENPTGVGNVASITSALSSATILRIGSDAQYNSVYRNTNFLFDQVNLIQAGFESNRVYWMDENVPVGVGAVVAEGAVKPYVQHSATLRSADYLVAARAYEFTNQFGWDFALMQERILGNGSIDLMNEIQSDFFVRLKAAAQAFTGANGISFSGGPGGISNVNDWDALVAMATVANNNSFGAASNSAIMSTYKQGRISIEKDTQGRYLNAPSYLDTVKMTGNPLLASDEVIVGDLKQYNLQLRGGMIVRGGLVNDNLVRNKFTVVQEQLYFDYISEARKSAIIKGTTFAAVKALI